ALPRAGETAHLAGSVHHRDRAAVVAEDRMVEEGDEIAAGREPRLADRAGRFVEDLADRNLQPPLASGFAHDGQIPSARLPVRPEDAVQDLPRRAPFERESREGAA